jgi:hypothetical protein
VDRRPAARRNEVSIEGMIDQGLSVMKTTLDKLG